MIPGTLIFSGDLEKQFQAEWHASQRVNDALWSSVTLSANMLQWWRVIFDSVPTVGYGSGSRALLLFWSISLATRGVAMLAAAFLPSRLYPRLRPWLLRACRVSRIAFFVIAYYKGGTDQPCWLLKALIYQAGASHLLDSINLKMLVHEQAIFGTAASLAAMAAGLASGGYCDLMQAALSDAAPVQCEGGQGRLALLEFLSVPIVQVLTLVWPDDELWRLAQGQGTLGSHCKLVLAAMNAALGIVAPLFVLHHFEQHQRAAFLRRRGYETPSSGVRPNLFYAYRLLPACSIALWLTLAAWHWAM